MSTDDEAVYNAALRKLLRGLPSLRVRPTRDAVAQGLASDRSEQGTIVGWGRHQWTVLVLRDGQKRPNAYNVRFWEPAR